MIHLRFEFAAFKTTRLPEEVLMRGLKATFVACIAAASLYAQSASRSAGWETYSGGSEGRRYSPLTQINTKNVSGLKLAWQYGVADAGVAVRSVGRAKPSQFLCAAFSTLPPHGGRSSR